MNAAVRFALLALILTVTYTALKSWLPVWAPLVGLAGLLTVAALLGAAGLDKLLANLEPLQEITGSEAYTCLFKAVGIILLTDYSRSLCRDAGLSAVGLCFDVGGRCLVLLTAWPVFAGVMQAIRLLSGQISGSAF